ncbi:multicopper oxidase family protein [Thermomonospora umbrina]|uniref:multicopper oxidase family protein n=1 Tax=Thermomonospora umbrina TaxID=111806 RepID=UPI001FEC1AE1|nr:multicopper oxidase domain-containing protein [Thermomonospora umbrina]
MSPVLTGTSAAGRRRSAVATLTKFADPLRIPPLLRAGGTITIRKKAATVRLHSQLPLTPVWTYEGSFPGPTIEVQRGQKLRVVWQNVINGAMPLVAVQVPFTGPASLGTPGRGGATPLADVAALPAFAVTHLHGAVTGAGNDGLPENAVLPGECQLTEYPNQHRAAGLWYHDHAMHITAFNVMAGLAGTFLIRDQEESSLGLPSGAQEIPLVIADRNLDTDDDGQLNGRLLHKVSFIDRGPAGRLHTAFIGPYNTVNGVIWPHLNVQTRWYRFRMLNAANSRPYTLELNVENADGTLTPVPQAFVQIGTDQGLLPAPLKLDRLTLVPAERADVLINFAAHKGKRLRLVNVDQSPAPLGPEVMQFRVDDYAFTDWFRVPDRLSSTYERLSPEDLPEHKERWVAFATDDGTPFGHQEMWELQPVAADYRPHHDHERLVKVTRADGTTVTLRKVASTYEEAATFFVERDGWEVWNFVHLAGQGHPAHVHLLEFQTLARDVYTVTSSKDPEHGFVTFTAQHQRTDPVAPQEQGWKDTVWVGERQVVTVAGKFAGGSGRYVYHCHMLEHEDEGMMRPFVVAPKQILARGAGHGH